MTFADAGGLTRESERVLAVILNWKSFRCARERVESLRKSDFVALDRCSWTMGGPMVRR